MTLKLKWTDGIEKGEIINPTYASMQEFGRDMWARLQRDTLNQLAILPSLLKTVKPGKTKTFRLQPIFITVENTADEKVEAIK